MPARSLGLIALAFLSIMVGLVSLYGALAMLLVGAVGTYAAAGVGIPMLVIGALYLGICVGAFAAAFGLWTRKHWAWAGAVTVFAVYVVANLGTAIIGQQPMVAVFPLISGVAGIWYLNRPRTKAELLGIARRPVPAVGGVGAAETMNAAGSVR